MSLLLARLSSRQTLPVAPFYAPRGAPDAPWVWSPANSLVLSGASGYIGRAPFYVARGWPDAPWQIAPPAASLKHLIASLTVRNPGMSFVAPPIPEIVWQATAATTNVQLLANATPVQLPQRQFYVPRGQGEPFWQTGPQASNAKALSTAAAPGQLPQRQFYVPRGWPDAPWVWSPPQNFETNYLYGGSPVGGEWSVDPVYEYAWQWAPPNATLLQPTATPPVGNAWLSTDVSPEAAWRWTPPAIRYPTPFRSAAWSLATTQDAIWGWEPTNGTVRQPVVGAPKVTVNWSASALQETPFWRWTPANDTLRQSAAASLPIGGAWWSIDVAQDSAWRWNPPNTSIRQVVQKPVAQFYAPRGAHVTDWVWAPPAAFAIGYLYGGTPFGGMWSADALQETVWRWSPPNSTPKSARKPATQFYASRGAHATDWTWVAPQNFVVNVSYGGQPVGGMWSFDAAQDAVWNWKPELATANQPPPPLTPAPAGGQWWIADVVPTPDWTPMLSAWGPPVAITARLLALVRVRARAGNFASITATAGDEG